MQIVPRGEMKYMREKRKCEGERNKGLWERNERHES